MNQQYAFVIMQIGAKGTPDRKRADDMYNFVISPILLEANLEPYRSDLDPTPGQVNTQMLRRLVEAQIVIADLTGRNPNVFYEFGIVHAFARPVIALVDSASSLPFDAHDERVIELGEHAEVLGAGQAEEAKAALREALKVVLAPDYIPASPLTELAALRSLDQLAPKNPIAAELAAIRRSLTELRDLQRSHWIDALSTPPYDMPSKWLSALLDVWSELPLADRQRLAQKGDIPDIVTTEVFNLALWNLLGPDVKREIPEERLKERLRQQIQGILES
jgi:hypothetical protein